MKQSRAPPSAKSFAQLTSSRWLRSYPILLTQLIRAINLFHRNRRISGITIGLFALAALLLCVAAGRGLALLEMQPIGLITLAAFIAALAAVRCRRHVRRDRERSWLAVTPIPVSLALRLVLWWALALGTLLLVVILAWALGALGRDVIPALLAEAAAGISIGTAVGALGFLSQEAITPDFHYASVGPPRAGWASAPSLAPLSFWAPARANAFTKPRNSARLLLIVLLSLPMGTGGQQAIAIALGALIVMQLLALTLAAMFVARDAARWLAVTAVRFWPFAAAVSGRVLLQQAAICSALILVVTTLPGQRPSMLAMVLSVLWLLASGGLMLGTCWLAERRRGAATAVSAVGAGNAASRC